MICAAELIAFLLEATLLSESLLGRAVRLAARMRVEFGARQRGPVERLLPAGELICEISQIGVLTSDALSGPTPG